MATVPFLTIVASVVYFADAESRTHIGDSTPTSLTLSVLLAGLASACLYLFPAIVAWYRRKRRAWVIYVLDLVLGWTVVVWIAALVWALLRDKLPAA